MGRGNGVLEEWRSDGGGSGNGIGVVVGGGVGVGVGEVDSRWRGYIAI